MEQMQGEWTMENLFFLLIFLIIIVSNVVSIRKRMKKQQEQEKEAASRPAAAPAGSVKKDQNPEAGWRRSLENFLGQLKEELEPVTEEPTGYGRRTRVPDEPLLEERTGKAREKKPDTRADKRTEAREVRHTAMERRSMEEKTSGRYGDANREIREAAAPPSPKKDVPEKGALAREFSLETGRSYSVAQLQKAVIWSEILGTPVSLRKEGGEPWLR